MGMHDRDWYRNEMKARRAAENQKAKSRFRFRLPKFRKRYDLSAYNFEKPPTWHPVLIALVWFVVFLVLFAIFKMLRG